MFPSKKWPGISVCTKFVNLLQVIKTTSWTNKQRTSCFDNGTHKTSICVFKKTFFWRVWLDHHETTSSRWYHRWFFPEPLVSCFHNLNNIHPGSHSWHQGFPKNKGVNKANASLEICASPSPCKLKQFCKTCLKTKSLNFSYKGRSYPPECLPSL